MNQASTTAGKRLLDVLDVHWYPEATGGGIRVTNDDNSAAVVAARLQAPRSLWDPTYVETSWITQFSIPGQAIDLLPRLKGQIASNYAGTKLSISEYNYGDGDHIDGGIAQADVLGIFGQQGVYSANEWQLASNEAFIGGAFAMFRNYNGNGGTFGDTSIGASTNDITDTSIYASLDSTDPHRMVLVALNKTNSLITSNIQLSNAGFADRADIYQLTSASATPVFVGEFSLNDVNSFSLNLSAMSVDTIVLHLVPEPGSVTLIPVGACGLLMRRRSRGAN